jgi:hypothetical protein
MGLLKTTLKTIQDVLEFTGEKVEDLVGDLPSLRGAPSTPNIAGRKTYIGQRSDIIESANKVNPNTLSPDEYLWVDPDLSAKYAREFDLMKHDPNNPRVKKAFAQMIEEVDAQYKQMLDDGVQPFFIRGDDPYKSSPYLALKDLHENRRLGVFPTKDGFGSDAVFDPSDNPLLGVSSHTLDGEPMLYNDLFRAVHDYYGHGKHGFGFRASGEDNAFRAHSGMFSPNAARAAATETRGQNSWLNYGPHGEQNRVAGIEDTIFADQKTGLLPNWVAMSRTPLADARRARAFQESDGILKRLEGAVDDDGLVTLNHLSNTPIERFDPNFYGKGLSGRSMAERNMAYNPDWTNRTFYGLDTAENPYKKELGLGGVQGEAKIPFEQLYDMKSDPDNFIPNLKGRNNQEKFVEFSNKVDEAGYSGFVQEMPAGKIAQVFDSLDNKKFTRPMGIATPAGMAVAGGGAITASAFHKQFAADTEAKGFMAEMDHVNRMKEALSAGDKVAFSNSIEGAANEGMAKAYSVLSQFNRRAANRPALKLLVERTGLENWLRKAAYGEEITPLEHIEAGLDVQP